MSLPRFPNYQDHKRVKYLINNDERLKRYAMRAIHAQAALMKFTDEEFGGELSTQICGCCAIEAGMLLAHWEQEAADGK